MKRADIDDQHVINLARRWQVGQGVPVGDALVSEGWPWKLVESKIEHLCSRGLLDYGTSPRTAWPIDPPSE